MAFSADDVHAGTILIAPPLSDDPNFRRTVVLICEHNEDGTFGLILNRELELHLGDVLEELESYSEPAFLGGPVQQNTLHYLHRLGDEIPESIPLANGVYWGGDFESVKGLVGIGRAAPDDLRFFLGYSGWTAGQLANEIEMGGWILSDVRPDLVFVEDKGRIWRDALRRMGGEFAILANFPDDPRMN